MSSKLPLLLCGLLFLPACSLKTDDTGTGEHQPEGDTDTDTDADTDSDADSDTDVPHAPTVLNGDFEEWLGEEQGASNLTNEEFTKLMPHGAAFGDYDQLDVYLDPGYVAGEQSRVVAVGAYGDRTDALSMELSESLRQGTNYRLSFEYAFYYDSVPQIGLSTDPFDFGEQISGSLAVSNDWSSDSITFEAPLDGTHLTLRNDDDGEHFQWVFWDNLVLEVLD